MTMETYDWLAHNILVGFTEKRGDAWWHRKVDANGGPANHFPQAVPLETVISRIFNWEAGYTSVFTGPDSEHVTQQDRFQAVVNTTTGYVFGIPTDSYRIHNRREWCLDTVSSVLDTSSGDLAIAGAGQLRNGAVSYVQFEMPDNVQVAGESFRPFITASTTLDSSAASQLVCGVTRVVCDNTLAANLAERGRAFSLRHTRNSVLDMSKARDALGIMHQVATDFEKEMDELCATVVTDRQFDKIVKALTESKPKPGRPLSARGITMAANKAAAVRRLYSEDPRVAPWKGTAFGVEQAFNTYRQHEGIVRNAVRPERNMLNALDGTGARLDAEVRGVLASVLAK